jgi:alpha-L-fucosidase
MCSLLSRFLNLRRLLMTVCAVASLSHNKQASLFSQEETKIIRIACIGNSITAGVGVSDPARFSYPAQLQHLLGPGWDVRNFGVSGRTLLSRGDFPYRNEPEFSAAQSFAPDVVIIKLGTNDSKPQNWQYKNQFVHDYEGFVETFQRKSSHPKIYLCTPVPAFPGDWGISDSIVRNEIVPFIRKVAEEKKLSLIDLYGSLGGKADYFPDKVHPNGDGARAIAWSVYQTLVRDFRLTSVPVPVGPVPSIRQLQWHDVEIAGFLHFNMNTFTDKEWGGGDESPSLFNPASFDADAIVRTAVNTGMKTLILTCKHHDGFCLWQTATTDHSIAQSPWKNGTGDIVRDLAVACRAANIRFGVYLSPWDRNSALYGTAAYLPFYRKQLCELLSNYGSIAEVWFDGANGGDGYYGGAREKRTIDRTTYYQWSETWNLVRELQPEAVMFSDVGPDIRWVGNENGFAGETCWSPYSPVGEKGDSPAPGYVRAEEGITGHRDGMQWIPAECDVSIRPGWFYHAAEDTAVKSAAELFEIYCNSVGRNGSLLLNVPPDRRGRISDADGASLKGFKEIIDETFRRNLITGLERVSNQRGKERRFGAENLTDGSDDTYWATDDSIVSASVTFSLAGSSPFNCIQLKEYIPLGQRVEEFAVEVPSATTGWKTIAAGTTIGHKRILRFSSVTASKLRLTIKRAKACPVLSEVGVYKAPFEFQQK